MLSQNELEAIFQEHIVFLTSSCQSFDAGFESEAKRLAVSVRVLVHDTSTSHSLLSQLGMKTIPFYSTAPKWDATNLLAHHGLLQVAGLEDGTWSYRAPLDDRPPHLFRWMSFDEWWTELVFDDRHGNTLTRKDIVLGLSNKEGGAHVDPNLTHAYEAITRHSILWFVETSEGVQPLAGKMGLLSMRQIAHELLTTFKIAG